MEKLEIAKNEIEEMLIKVIESSGRFDQALVKFETFEAFAKHYQEFLNEKSDFATRKKMLQKFLKRIEIGPQSVKIHFNVDQAHYERELALMAGSRQPSRTLEYLKCVGSNSLTNGAHGGTRTPTPYGTGS